MTVRDLMMYLIEFSPDTPVRVMDGNLLTGDVHEVMYGALLQDANLLDAANDGEGDDPDAVYLMTP